MQVRGGERRLEGGQVLTSHPGTLSTAHSAVSSGTGMAQIPNPLCILHQLLPPMA